MIAIGIKMEATRRFEVKIITCLSIVAAAWLMPNLAQAMHIMEGFLPPRHALFWLVAVAPFLLIGIVKINRLLKDHPDRKLLLGLVTAFVFVLSALKMPSVTGSSSHATGIGLAAILFGPWVAGIAAGIVLAFQALLLAHGGLTTWGANTFSMGIAGGVTAYLVFRGARAAGLSDKVAVFAAAALLPTPVLSLALYGWLGLVEFSALRWLTHQEVSREELLTMLLAAVPPAFFEVQS